MEWMNFLRMDEWAQRSRWFRERERSEGGLPTMTPADFLTALESHLRTHAIPFARAELIAFVESSWPLIADNPDVVDWCERLAATPAGE
jgi:hypothetical protein